MQERAVGPDPACAAVIDERVVGRIIGVLTEAGFPRYALEGTAGDLGVLPKVKLQLGRGQPLRGIATVLDAVRAGYDLELPVARPGDDEHVIEILLRPEDLASE